MFQKNIQLVVFFICTLFCSCVDDDICDKESTPRVSFKLVNPSMETYLADSLFIDKVNLDGSISTVGLFLQVDSLKIPLNPTSEETVFYLYNSSNTTKDEKDVITIKYQTEQEFVSKACGLKSIFKSVSYELTNSNKIQKITANSTEINDESQTNLYITY